MLNGKYKGQKLMNEVSTKILAKTPKTIATVPEMVFVKYKIPITIAILIRIALSVVPMFFAMFVIFLKLIITLNSWQSSEIHGNYSATLVT